MSFIMMTPQEISIHIAKQMQTKRLAMNFSQQTLAERSGVSFGTLKKFERTGKISLESLLKLALTLEALQEFMALFTNTESAGFISLDDLLKKKTRKRGRQ